MHVCMHVCIFIVSQTISQGPYQDEIKSLILNVRQKQKKGEVFNY